VLQLFSLLFYPLLDFHREPTHRRILRDIFIPTTEELGSSGSYALDVV
jgi:hypothetical protein